MASQLARIPEDKQLMQAATTTKHIPDTIEEHDQAQRPKDE
jgi:hypothetical protein